jgi:hypothetical protein
MIRIAVTAEAYDVLDATLAGAVMRPVERSATGEVFVRLERLGQHSEDVSDVIVRLASAAGCCSGLDNRDDTCADPSKEKLT